MSVVLIHDGFVNFGIFPRSITARLSLKRWVTTKVDIQL